MSDTEADVREGQDMPKVCARWHYDWSTPGRVTLTVTDSAYLAPGSYHSVEAKPTPDGGSDIHGVWDNTATNRAAKLGMLMMHVAGRKFFAVYYKRVFDRLAKQARHLP